MVKMTGLVVEVNVVKVTGLVVVLNMVKVTDFGGCGKYGESD